MNKIKITIIIELIIVISIALNWIPRMKYGDSLWFLVLGIIIWMIIHEVWTSEEFKEMEEENETTS